VRFYLYWGFIAANVLLCAFFGWLMWTVCFGPDEDEDVLSGGNHGARSLSAQ
jgi:hypothetical protein